MQSNGQLDVSRMNFTAAKRLDVGHGWCGHAAQVCSTMSVLAVDAFP